MLTGMNDQTYDSMVNDCVRKLNLKQKALGKIGLDESQISEIKPVNFEGYDFSGEYMARLGKDGYLRSSKYEITWLFFGDTQVFFYCYSFDMTSNEKKESTEEYFYKDITNFATSTESVKYDGEKTKDINIFKLVVPGDKISCALNGTPENEKAIQAMKQKLREKKNG